MVQACFRFTFSDWSDMVKQAHSAYSLRLDGLLDKVCKILLP
jgi:hypothetical protein